MTTVESDPQDDGCWELCGECYAAYLPVDDPDDLDYYLHDHLDPADLVWQFTVPALRTYLEDVIGERWAGQLLEQYGVDLVRETLYRYTGFHGYAFSGGAIHTPAAYLRYQLHRARVGGVDVGVDVKK